MVANSIEFDCRLVLPGSICSSIFIIGIIFGNFFYLIPSLHILGRFMESSTVAEILQPHSKAPSSHRRSEI